MKQIDYFKSPPKAARPRLAWKKGVLTTYFMLMAFFLQAQHPASPVKVTMHVKDASLEEVFRSIRKQTGYSFLYNDASLEGTKPVTMDLDRADLDEVLQTALAYQPITYTKSGNTIILKAVKAITPQQMQQENTLVINGRVVDAKTKEPVIGASVSIQGTKTGVISGANGEYQIRITRGAKLQISFMGYETYISSPLTSSGNYVHPLNISQQSIKDVVVTGVFSRPKQIFTGAASSFTQEDLMKVTNTNVLSALASLDPSFQMPQNITFGSDPNRLPDVVVRGGNSLVDISQTNNANVFNYNNSPNIPLFILDGFETSLQRINDLDMNRIVKVDILKDAAATAIYGSRAANGVIVIETLRPQSGKLRISYNTSVQIEAPDLSGYDLLNASEKLELERQSGIYNNSFNVQNEQLQYFYNARRAAVERGVNTDWLSKPLRTGVGQRHNIYLEGGGQDALYGINLTFNGDAGVMKGSNRNNTTASTYLSYRVQNFQFRNDLTLNFNKANNSPYGTFSTYTRLNPYWTPYDSLGNMKIYLEEVRNLDGGYLSNFDTYGNGDGTPTGRAVNPLYNTTLHTVDQTRYQSLTNNFWAQWQAFPWLRISTRVAYTQQKDESDNFRPAQHTAFMNTAVFDKGLYTKGYGQRNTIEGMLTADFNKRYGMHMIFATLGANLQDVAYNTTVFSVQGFPNPRLDELILGNKFPDNSKPTGTEFKSRLAGYLSNLSYSYDNRYLLDLSFRLDGSSQFGSEKRFAPFWSAGAGWNLHNEKFMRDQLPFVNRLKLRYSVGSTGSQNFPSYLGITTSQYYTSQDYRGIIGTRLLGYGNEALAWQQTLKNNVGADLTLFKNHIDISGNYFIEKTQGSIANISLAPSTGFSSYAENMGDVVSKGWELNLRVNIISKPNSRDVWSVFVNAFSVKNTIERVSNTLQLMNKRADTTLSTTPLIRYAEGQSTSAIWAVRSLGIDPATGNEVFLKKDGTLTNYYSPLDQIIAGDSRPKVEGTFGTNVELRGIGLNLLFRVRYGGQAYNQTLIDRVENVNVGLYNVDRRVSEQRWMKPGDVTFFKAITPQGGFTNTLTRASTRFVQDDNELRCESLNVYYRLSDRLNRSMHLQNTRITFYTGDLFRVSSIKRERGLNYPFSHTYSLQLQTTF